MTTIKIPFNEWSKDKLRRGIKTVTSRNIRYGDAGDEFSVDLGGKTVTYLINRVSHVPLSTVAAMLYRREGCESPEEFKRVWAEIYPLKGFIPDQMVFVHAFLPILETSSP